MDELFEQILKNLQELVLADPDSPGALPDEDAAELVVIHRMMAEMYERSLDARLEKLTPEQASKLQEELSKLDPKEDDRVLAGLRKKARQRSH